jgi:hypothetical protein
MSDKSSREAAILAAAIGLVETLEFYGEPESYFALMVVGDAPCGEFIGDTAPISEEDAEFYDDFRDGGAYFGKRAREALAAWRRAHDPITPIEAPHAEALAVLQDASGHTVADAELIMLALRERGYVLVPVVIPDERDPKP